jgi:hypothetical protein
MQWLGGASYMSYNWIFNTYHWEPDAQTDDLTGYSTSLVNFIDYIRRAFSNMLFLTQGIIDIQAAYGFKFSLAGLHKAEGLPYEHRDGRNTVVYGYGIHFESSAIDNDTNFSPIGANLENIIQSGSTVTNELGVPWQQNVTIPIYMQTTYYDIPPNSFVPFIGMTTETGTPQMEIVDGNGNLVFGQQLVGEFSGVTPQIYSGASGLQLVFTKTGDGLVNTNVTVVRNYFKAWVS